MQGMDSAFFPINMQFQTQFCLSWQIYNGEKWMNTANLFSEIIFLLLRLISADVQVLFA